MAGIGRYLLGGLGVGNDIPHFVLGGLAPTGVVKSISVSPSSIQTNQVGVILTVTGTGTTWNSVGPSFSFSGVAGLSITHTTVLSDTSAQITVTSGAAVGTATLTDATSGTSTTLHVVAPASGGSGGVPGRGSQSRGVGFWERRRRGRVRGRLSPQAVVRFRILDD